MEGKVGATATLIRAGKAARTLHYHLRQAEEYTVHEAELIGILLGLHLISTDKKGRTSTAIDVDNQAAVKAFQSDLRNPGQHLVRVAGHEGVDGNELADAEARMAAQGEHSYTKILPAYLRKKLLINPTRPRRSNRNIIESVRWRGRKGGKERNPDKDCPGKTRPRFNWW